MHTSMLYTFRTTYTTHLSLSCPGDARNWTQRYLLEMVRDTTDFSIACVKTADCMTMGGGEGGNKARG